MLLELGHDCGTGRRASETGSGTLGDLADGGPQGVGRSGHHGLHVVLDGSLRDGRDRRNGGGDVLGARPVRLRDRGPVLLPRMAGRSLATDLVVDDALDVPGGCTGGVGRTTVVAAGLGGPSHQEPPHQDEPTEEEQEAQRSQPPTFVGGRCDRWCLTHGCPIPITRGA
jgi:hypothetical protein